MQVSSTTSVQAVELMRQMREAMASRTDSARSGGLDIDAFADPGRGHRNAGAADSAGPAASPMDLAKEMFSRLDADRDGSVTRAEMDAGRPDGPPPPDGVVAPDTMRALFAATQEGSTDSAAATAGKDRAAEPFASLDTDGDGTLSAAEFEAGAKRPEPPPGGAAPEDRDDGQSGLSSLGGTLSDQLLAVMAKAVESYMQAGSTSHRPNRALSVSA